MIWRHGPTGYWHRCSGERTSVPMYNYATADMDSVVKDTIIVHRLVRHGCSGVAYAGCQGSEARLLAISRHQCGTVAAATTTTTTTATATATATAAAAAGF